MFVCFLMTVPHLEGVQARDQSEVLKARQLIGMKVEGTDGRKLGTIKAVVVDPDDGSIEYAVLDFGGLAGIGDKYFAVPWQIRQFLPHKKKVFIDVSKKALKDAPGFDKKHWPDLSDRQQVVTIYEYYDVALPEGQTGD
jgi:sporulation protein YlmC with PRC-barrel domain